jgi:glycosyltransferase involved in cell wall biosynthesis
VNDGSTQLYNHEWFQSVGCKYFFNSNSGNCEARNFGAKKSSYDWVAILDDDDFWEEHHLETLFLSIQRVDEPTSVIYTRVKDYYANDVIVERYFSKRNNGLSDLEYMLTGGYRMPSASCYRKEILEICPWHQGNFRFSEDYWHSMRLVQHGKASAIDEATVFYNNITVSATRGNDLLTFRDAIASFKEMSMSSEFAEVSRYIFHRKLVWWYSFALNHLASTISFFELVESGFGVIKWNYASVKGLKYVTRFLVNIRLVLISSFLFAKSRIRLSK